MRLNASQRVTEISAAQENLSTERERLFMKLAARPYSRRKKCKFVKLARARQARDLKEGHKRRLWFDERSAERVCDFCEKFLRHIKGPMAGAPLVLMDWQKEDIIYPVFGWKKLPPGMTANQAEKIPLNMQQRSGIVRRFRRVYQEIARKNGKSTMLAAVGLYGLDFDFEGGAEIYTAATKLDQAKMVFTPAEKMARRSPALARRYLFRLNRIEKISDGSIFRPLASDANTLDGLNSHMNLIDEYHAHPNSDVYDVLTTGEGARLQSLSWIITTAGYNKNGPCFQERKYAEKLLEGIIENDEYFAIIYTLDNEDDWRDPLVWEKANPNIGTSLSYEYIDGQVRKAQNQTSYMHTVKTKNLNIWLSHSNTFLHMQRWAECGGDADPAEWRAEQYERLAGRDCVAGLDLGSTSDFTSFVLLFPDEDETITVLPYFWLAEDPINEREERLRRNYYEWNKDGFLIYTPGQVTDVGVVENDIEALSEHFNIADIAIDRSWQGHQLALNLQNTHSLPVIAFPQTYAQMNQPTHDLERLVIGRKVRHGNNPILAFMASNTEVKTNSGGEIKPVKPDHKNPYKIDGIVSFVMALARKPVLDEQAQTFFREVNLDDYQ